MHQYQRELIGTFRLRLPVTVASNPAPVAPIHFDRFLDTYGTNAWARKEIANDGLQMAILQASSRLEGGKPDWPLVGVRVNLFLFLGSYFHWKRQIAGKECNGLPDAQADLGRLVGIEPTTS